MKHKEELVIHNVLNMIDMGWSRESCIHFALYEGYSLESAIKITDEAFARLSEGYEKLAK